MEPKILDIGLHVVSFFVMFIGGALGIKYKLNGTIIDVAELKAKVDKLEGIIHKMDKKLAVILATCPLCNVDVKKGSD